MHGIVTQKPDIDRQALRIRMATFWMLCVFAFCKATAQDEPSVLVPPRSQTNWARNNIILSAAATGSPPLSFQWLRHGIPISGQTNALHLLPMTTTNDTGQYSVVVTNVFGSITSAPALLQIRGTPGPGTVVSWSVEMGGELINVPTGVENVTAVAASGGHNLALKEDGTVVEWGVEFSPPPDLSNVIAIAVGHQHAVAVKYDGTLVVWGDNSVGQTDVPTGLRDVVAVSAMAYDTLALKNDGTVVAWGANYSGQSTVPESVKDVCAISSGGNYHLALKSDGTVIAWGFNWFGQADVPKELSNVVSVAACPAHCLALKSDGSIAVWGKPSQDYGQTIIPDGLSGVAALAGGFGDSVALKNDGSVATWGWSTNVPVGLGGVTSIAAGFNHVLALTTIGRLPIRLFVDGVFVSDASVLKEITASIGIHTLDTNVTISYSVDGSVPTGSNAFRYTGIFTITNTSTLRILAANTNDSSTTLSDPFTVFVRHPLTLTTAGGGLVSMMQSSSNTDVTISAMPEPGYSFVCWTDGTTGTNQTMTITADRPKTVRAVFGTMVNTTESSNGIIAMSPFTGPYPYGSTVEITAIPIDGCFFSHWEGEASGCENPLRFMVTNANSRISAVFERAATNQTLVFGPLPDRVLGEGPIRLNALASSGLPVTYSVVSGPATVERDQLTINGAGRIVVRAVQSGNTEFSAVFAESEFTVFLALDVLVSGYGTVIRNPALERYTNGTIVTLTAVPDFETVFTGWSGSASGSNNPIQILMESNRVVVAGFLATNGAIANIQLTDLSFDPHEVDVSGQERTITVTARLTSGSTPIERVLLHFTGKYQTLELEMGPQNLVAGTLRDGAFQGCLLVNESVPTGGYSLYEVLVFEQSGRYKCFRNPPSAQCFPFPDGTYTNLLITATNAVGWVGATWSGIPPAFHDSNNNYAGELPCVDWQSTKYSVRRGETRPFTCVAASYVKFSGATMNVSSKISAPEGAEAIEGYPTIRLLRAWTKDYLPGWGDTQRVIDYSPPDGIPCDAPIAITMLENGPNAPTWSVFTEYLVTPPSNGFQKDFTLGFYNLVYGNTSSSNDVGVVVNLCAGLQARFIVQENAPFPIASLNRNPSCGNFTLSWFAVMGLSYHVQWKSDIDAQWHTLTNGFVGADTVIHWTDDGKATASITDSPRFYRVMIP